MQTNIRNEQIVFKNPNRPVKISESLTYKGALSDRHFHSELEFLYIKEGRLLCHTDNGDITLTDGDILFINSKTPHSTTALSDQLLYTFVQFRNPTSIKGPLSYMLRFINSLDPGYFFFAHDDAESSELASYITAMTDAVKNNDFAYDYFITANVYLIVSLLHRKRLLPVPEIFEGRKELVKLQDVFEYISENYGENITLGELSRTANLNESYLCRLFKKASGRTLIDYVNFVRVCNAEKLLKSDMSISDVAYQVGFSTLSHFNHIFRKYNRSSPSEYRRMSNQTEQFT